MNQKFSFFYWGVFSLGLVFVCEVGNASPLIVGESIRYASEADNPSVCKIRISNFGSSDKVGLCSGTLVPSDTEFGKLTADQHCFGRYFNPNDHEITVECGGRRVASPVEIQLPDSNNDELWRIIKAEDSDPEAWSLKNSADDFAILSLPRDKKGRNFVTSPIATGPEKYFLDFGLLKPGVECKIMGYGINDIRIPEIGEATNDNSGYLVEGLLKNMMVSYFKATRLIQFSGEKFGQLSSSAAGGDSGGPLFCKVPGSEFELLGTILSRAENSESKIVSNLVNPIWFHIKIKPNPVSAAPIVPIVPITPVFLEWPGYDPYDFEHVVSPFSLMGPDSL